MKQIIVLLTLLFAYLSSSAAVPKSVDRMGAWLSSPGAIRGGVATPRISIRDFRFIKSQKTAAERLIFEFGDKEFKPLLSGPGYYQIQLKNNPTQVVVNFSQTLNNKIDPLVLMQRLKKSSYVKNVRVEFDRSNQSMNFIFDLKSMVSVRASSVKEAKQAGRLFLDMKARAVKK